MDECLHCGKEAPLRKNGYCIDCNEIIFQSNLNQYKEFNEKEYKHWKDMLQNLNEYLDRREEERKLLLELYHNHKEIIYRLQQELAPGLLPDDWAPAETVINKILPYPTKPWWKFW